MQLTDEVMLTKSGKPFKPMSEKQTQSILNIEKYLSVEYEGPNTAQAAMFFISEHAEELKAYAEKQVEIMRQAIQIQRSNCNYRYFPDATDRILSEMAACGWDGAPNAMDCDLPYGETPDIDSLRDDCIRFSRWL